MVPNLPLVLRLSTRGPVSRLSTRGPVSGLSTRGPLSGLSTRESVLRPSTSGPVSRPSTRAASITPVHQRPASRPSTSGQHHARPPAGPASRPSTSGQHHARPPAASITPVHQRGRRHVRPPGRPASRTSAGGHCSRDLVAISSMRRARACGPTGLRVRCWASFAHSWPSTDGMCSRVTGSVTSRLITASSRYLASGGAATHTDHHTRRNTTTFQEPVLWIGAGYANLLRSYFD